MEDKNSSLEREAQGINDEDFKRLMLLAERNFCSALNIVVGADGVSNQDSDNLQLFSSKT